MSVAGALLNRWDEVRSSYWFLPLLMGVGTVALSFATLELDGRLANRLKNAGWLYSGSPEGARSVLQTIATSMIGVAGVVFSITTVTLTLAAKQFGPRIFRNFMRDTGTQVVLGTFISTFLYCLLILRQVHGSDGGSAEFIPQLSMFVAVLFATASLGVLIYFIHHVAAKIQTPNVLAAVGADLLAAIRDLYPEQIGNGAEQNDNDAGLREQIPAGFEERSAVIGAPTGGYIRQLEADQLVRVASGRDLLVRVERRPGEFVASGDPLLRIWPPDRANEEVRNELRGVVVIGDQRTPNQDVTFPVGQLVEVATLALSPAVNDLTTAEMSIDRLGEGFALLTGRVIPSAYRTDPDGRLRVIAPPVNLPGLLDRAVDPIRVNGRTQPTVMVRLLNALAGVAARATRSEDRTAIREHAMLVHEQAAAATLTPHDRRLLATAFESVRLALAEAAERQPRPVKKH